MMCLLSLSYPLSVVCLTSSFHAESVEFSFFPLFLSSASFRTVSSLSARVVVSVYKSKSISGRKEVSPTCENLVRTDVVALDIASSCQFVGHPVSDNVSYFLYLSTFSALWSLILSTGCAWLMHLVTCLPKICFPLQKSRRTVSNAALLCSCYIEGNLSCMVVRLSLSFLHITPFVFKYY